VLLLKLSQPLAYNPRLLFHVLLMRRLEVNSFGEQRDLDRWVFHEKLLYARILNLRVVDFPIFSEFHPVLVQFL